MADRAERPFDIVVFGATSFVGQILCRTLVERHGIDGDLRWAIAGRSAAKLDAVAEATGAHVDRILADAADSAALAALAESTRLVISTVGPYARYGSDLVAAVVEAGTDYCDLTGEPQWMQRMIDLHQHRAEQSGARVVHACGFDSIPSDLGVWFTQQRALEQFGEPCVSIGMRVHTVRGGASGGTIASVMNLLEEASHDAEIRQLLSNPYALAPVGQRSGVDQPDVTAPRRDGASGQWVGPFVMAAVNTRVVHRTHALLGRPWGSEFTYSEALLMGDGPLGAAKAAAVAGGVLGFSALAAIGPVRSVLNRFVLPQPGEGPSVQAQESGGYDLRFFGATAAGQRIETKVVGVGDPGYSSTARMLAEAATTLARSEVGGGMWTPASALGAELVEALIAHAQIEFAVRPPVTAVPDRW